MQNGTYKVGDDQDGVPSPRDAYFLLIVALMTHPTLAVLGYLDEVVFTGIILLPMVVVAMSLYPRSGLNPAARKLLNLGLGVWVVLFACLAFFGFVWFPGNLVWWLGGSVVAAVPNLVFSLLIGRTGTEGVAHD